MKDNYQDINRLNDTENLSLLLEIGFSDFSVLVFDKLKKEIVYTESISFTNIQQLKDKSKVISKTFDDVKVALFTPDFTIVPHALLETDSEKKFLALACGEKTDEHRSTHLPFIAATIIFYYPSQIINIVKTNFPNAEIEHAAKGLISMSNRDNNAITIHLYNNYFMASYFRNNELQLLNSFEYNHFNDLIYSLLFIVKEFDLNNIETTLCISGFYNPNHIPLMEKYFKEVIAQPSSITNDQASRFVLLESLK